ncbi:LysE family translocator [Novosphingobium sp.]|uniref:LysE family translocator n=1 Tax=Novosphingobium sp. TaxID=1874826 RepID=UPI0038B9D157
MNEHLLLALTAFAFVSSVTPGPNNLMLMASGTNFGFGRTIPHMLGVSIGFTLMIVLVGAGLRQLFAAFPVFYTGLKWGSVAYLAYLAVKVATAAPPTVRAAAGTTARPLTFTQAALFQWVNPKAWTMALTACSAYVGQDNPLRNLLIVAGVFGAINLPTVSAWAYLGVQMRRFLDDQLRLRIFNVTAALLLLGSLYPVVFGQA